MGVAAAEYTSCSEVRSILGLFFDGCVVRLVLFGGIIWQASNQVPRYLVVAHKCIASNDTKAVASTVVPELGCFISARCKQVASWSTT